MAQKVVVDAVAARLAANWTHCPVREQNDGQGATPTDGSAFLAVQYPVANSEQMSIGSPGANIWREEGVIRLVLNVKRGTGIATAGQWADELAAMFRGKTFDGVETFAPSSTPLDDSNEAGNYFSISVAVPYQNDLIG